MLHWKHQNKVTFTDISDYMAAVGSGVQQSECKFNDMTVCKHNNLKKIFLL